MLQLRAEVKELHYQRDIAQTELAKFRKRFAEEEEDANNITLFPSIFKPYGSTQDLLTNFTGILFITLLLPLGSREVSYDDFTRGNTQWCQIFK